MDELEPDVTLINAPRPCACDCGCQIEVLPEDEPLCELCHRGQHADARRPGSGPGLAQTQLSDPMHTFRV